MRGQGAVGREADGPGALVLQAVKVYRAGEDAPIAAIKDGAGDASISSLHW